MTWGWITTASTQTWCGRCLWRMSWKLPAATCTQTAWALPLRGHSPMPALATGIDLIEIARMQSVIERHGERFLRRVFTPQELAEVGENAASLAARFAA